MKKKLVLLSAAIAVLGLIVSCDLGDFGDSIEDVFTKPLVKVDPPIVTVTVDNIEEQAKNVQGDPAASLSLLESIVKSGNKTDAKVQAAAITTVIEAVNLGGTLVGGVDELMKALDSSNEDDFDPAKILDKLTDLQNLGETSSALQEIFGKGNNTYDVSNLAESGVNSDDMALAGLALLIADIKGTEGGTKTDGTINVDGYGDSLMGNFMPTDSSTDAENKKAAILRARLAYQTAKKDKDLIGNDEVTEAIARSAAALGAFDVYGDSINTAVSTESSVYNAVAGILSGQIYQGTENYSSIATQVQTALNAVSTVALPAAQAVAEVIGLSESETATNKIASFVAQIAYLARADGKSVQDAARLGGGLFSIFLTDAEDTTVNTAALNAQAGFFTYQSDASKASNLVNLTQFPESTGATVNGPLIASRFAAVYAASAKARNPKSQDYSDLITLTEALTNAVNAKESATLIDKTFAEKAKDYVKSDKDKLSGVIDGSNLDILTIASILPSINTNIDGDDLNPELKLGLALISAAAEDGNGMISGKLSEMLDGFTK